MSHLRAPAPRADRREGGRHGRPAARPAPALPETHIRSQLMRLAVLPPLAVALSASAAVMFSIRSTGARTGPVLWAVLSGAVAVAVAGILIAAVAADRAARMVTDRVDALRRTAARGEADLHALVDALRQGEAPPQRNPRRRPPADADDFELLAADLARAHDGAVTAVVRAAQLSSQTGSEQKLEVFVNLARRLQSLVHREISILDDLENEIEDPDLLKGLFHVDHLATRIRRHAENLAVLGGAVSRRQWSNPVSMTEVLRSAIAEVEQYSRVKLVPPIDGELRGHAVADVIHLLAELIENASVFSAPHTQVLLRANLVTSGLAVEVEDRGLGMPVGEQNRMNALLADPDQVNVASLLADGRIGLYVVSQLARRHGIHVRLQSNIYGGVQAVLVVPQALLGNVPATPAVPVAHGTDAGAGAGGAGEDRGAGAGADTAVPQPQPQPQAAIAADTGSGRQARVSVPPPAREPGSGAGNEVSSRTAAGVERGTGNGVPAGNGSPAGTDAVTGSGAVTGNAPGAGSGAVIGNAPVAGSGAVIGSGGVTGSEGESAAGVAETPATGRRRHAQRGSGRRGAENGARGRHGDAPAPLPVRGADRSRPTPAAAVPGVSAEDRAVVEAQGGVLPTPRVGPVRGTIDKPRLPRRRAQEHIVPQLRGGPLPRQDSGTVAGHDPGLMAAFQRGIGLAEAQQSLESEYAGTEYAEPRYSENEYTEPECTERHHGTPAHGTPLADTSVLRAAAYGHMDSDHTGSLHMARNHTTLDHMGSEHTVSGHMSSSSDHTLRDHMGPDHTGPDHTAPNHMGPDHTGPDHTAPDHMGPEHTVSGRTGSSSDHTGQGAGHTGSSRTGADSMDPSPIPPAHAHAPAIDGIRGTGRPEGSAPAG
ncbi:ATP-binding protein [Streptomyces sp. SID486]|nr:ATP-binding protein [Streptomyces sp. SID486]MYX97609.1 ATP-binding protein [Streptomyces sp. SID486]